jgi:hypothetical protein
MRAIPFVILVAGCATDSDPLAGAPADCQPGHLAFTYMGQSGDMTFTSYYFENAIGSTGGTLDIGDLAQAHGGDEIFIKFVDLIPDGKHATARGYAKLSLVPIDAGNCITVSAQPSTIEVVSSTQWRFALTALKADPYCTGAAVAGTFLGCFAGN